MAVDVEYQFLHLIGRQQSGYVARRSCRLVIAVGFGKIAQVKLVSVWRVQIPVAKFPGQPVFAACGVLTAGGEVSERMVNAHASVNERAVIGKAFCGHVFLLGKVSTAIGQAMESVL